MDENTNQTGPVSPFETARNRVVGAARVASDATTAATLKLANAAMQTISALGKSLPVGPGRKQQYITLLGIKDYIPGIVSHPEAHSVASSIHNDADNGTETDTLFKKLAAAVSYLVHGERKKRKEAKRKQREDDKLNHTMDLLDHAFAPTLLLEGYHDEEADRTAARYQTHSLLRALS